MNYKLKLALIALTGLLALPVQPTRADETSGKAREVFNKNSGAVVTLSVVVNVTMSGRSSETKAEVTGTVVDPSGLTVVPLSSVDPSGMAEKAGVKVEIEVSDIKVMLADGNELAAEIVLRDKDLDLAFIRLKAKPAKPMVAIDLAQSAPAQVLDEVLTINRLGQAAGRAHAASIERVSAVVQKPRLFYIPDSMMTATREGSPAFTLDGKVLGLFVLRSVSSKDGGQNRGGNVTSIILPAEDVLKAAKQAPEAKGDSEKKEPAKEAAKETKPADAK